MLLRFIGFWTDCRPGERTAAEGVVSSYIHAGSKIGVLVEVKEAYLHCAKAVNRAGLWDPSRHIDRNDLPSYGAMLVDHCEGLTPEESERQGAEMARRGMY